MTGLLIVAAVVALLMIALEPAHRRAQRGTPSPFRPGADLTTDRDHERALAEIATMPRSALTKRDLTKNSSDKAWAAAPLRRADPRLNLR